MLINGARLIGCPILSIHVGDRIAQIVDLIIDPDTLQLLAVRVDGPLIRDGVGNILMMDSVRDFSNIGLIVDSIDELVAEEDAIRLQKVLKINFQLPGKKVVTKKKDKLGKVTDFILRSDTWEIYQLIVQRPLVKSFIDPELLIHRNQIIEVDDYQVVVKQEKEKPKAKTRVTTPAEDFVPDFVNPFRKPDFAQETIRKEN